MLRRTSLGFAVLLFTFAGFTLAALAEKKPPHSNLADLVEFPVYLQQKVAAGITPVGTKVQAKLTISTLFHGTVIPRDAVLSGEVTESQAKSSESPSKLGIRVDLAQWKNGSLPIKVYLTEWYYPSKLAMAEDGNPGYSAIHGSVGVAIGGGGNSYPPPNSPGGGEFPNSEPSTFPPDPQATTSSDVSPHRVRMKDVESTRSDDGSIALTSKKTSLKLDKSTTYVMASGSLGSQK